MLRRLFLPLFILIATHEVAHGHQIGLAEQMLQPVTVPNSLLPLLAVGLLWRQQPKQHLTRVRAFVIGTGLTVGLLAEVLLAPACSQSVFALALAAVAGGLVALAYPTPSYCNLLFSLALGVAIGLNLSSETTDWSDLIQTLIGALIGILVVLHFLTSSEMPTNSWQPIAARIVGSWILAIAIMVLALEFKKTYLKVMSAWTPGRPRSRRKTPRSRCEKQRCQ